MTSTSKIKKQILRQRGVGSLEKHTRKPLSIADTPAYYHKTTAMKLIELKFNQPIDKLIFTGSIYTVGEKLGIDPTTISKWRKALSEAKEAMFWQQFPDPEDRMSM